MQKQRNFKAFERWNFLLKYRNFFSPTFSVLFTLSPVQLRLHVQEYNKDEQITRIRNLQCRWKILLQIVKDITGQRRLQWQQRRQKTMI